MAHKKDGTSGAIDPSSSFDISEGLDPREFIGEHLRAARLERNISLRELARRVGVSPSFVSQVELGKAKPSLGTLYSFLSELNLSLDEIMPSGPEAPYAPAPIEPDRVKQLPDPVETSAVPWPWEETTSPVQRADGRRKIQLTGVTWQRLTSHDDALVDFLHVTYEPGAQSCPPDHLMRHVGREYGHILSGSLDVQVGFQHYRLNPGDSISFDSATPHRLSNEGSLTCVSIWVVAGRRSWPGTADGSRGEAHMPSGS
jgi:transcriptional regulator with XRE-family HTH domain